MVRSRASGGAGLGSVVAGLLAMMVVSCSTPPETATGKDYARALPDGAPALVRVTDPAEFPDMKAAWDDRDATLAALDESLAYFAKPSSQLWFPYKTADREIAHAEQVQTLEALRAILVASEGAGDFQAWCSLAFDYYRSAGWDGGGEVLFTAYCEPIFEGRLEPDATFRYPLYKLPPDLVKDEHGKPLGRRTESGEVVPYHARGELEQQGLLDGLELVYLKDPFEVYIAHVQGSARIDLPNGTQMCVGYAGKTDRPYVSIGRRLVAEGHIKSENLSLVRLRRYFREQPSELTRVLPVNESYVFFLERGPGPFGSLGCRVTPYHTVATDKAVFPRGGPVVVVSRLPVEAPLGNAGPGKAGVRYANRTCLAFDQDTGGGIRSAGRADLFIGTGPEAERLAGYTQEEGRLFYFFIKKRPVLP